MVISGGGAGINELTALAVTSELVPTAKRGKYVAILIFTIVPYTPSIFWAELVASRSQSAWRWLGLWCGGWALLGMVLTFIFYHPGPRVNSMGLSRREIIAQIDFVGGLLSIGGIILFTMGLVWGGDQYAWNSGHVLGTIVLGSVMAVAFGLWEAFGAKYPMFPKRLRAVPRTLGLTLLITFISGANFFAILIFWPSQSYNVYGHDPVGNGWRGLPVAVSILTGAVVVLVLLSVYRGHNRALLVGSSVLMTVGTGTMTILNRDNVQVSYVLLSIAGLGIGGIVVPASIMATIICPDDLIATVAALTLSIRVIGGVIGYSAYYNVLYSKAEPLVTQAVIQSCLDAGVYNITIIEEVGALLAASLDEEILPLLGNQTQADVIIAAAQIAFAEAYKWVYYVSIPFGVVCIVAACFLEDMSPYMVSLCSTESDIILNVTLTSHFRMTMSLLYTVNRYWTRGCDRGSGVHNINKRLQVGSRRPTVK
jgi:hypothetical protein